MSSSKPGAKATNNSKFYAVTYMYRHYILAAIVLAVVFASMACMLVRDNRLQANDTPQLLAIQVAKQLDAELGLSSVNMGATDLANNPVPFVIIYDKDGRPVGGSGYLDAQLATIPAGVLEHAKPMGHAVTWQPADGVRLATVTVTANDYYIVGGQSLAQTDSRAKRTVAMAVAGYAGTVLLLMAYAVLRPLARRLK